MTADGEAIVEYVMPEVRAKYGVPVTVVSAVTEKGVVRGISHFTSVPVVAAEVRKAVGMLAEDVEWSWYRYLIPQYFGRLSGLSGYDVPGGIWLFRWSERTTDWRDPEHRLASDEGELLWVPTGWVNQQADGR